MKKHFLFEFCFPYFKCLACKQKRLVISNYYAKPQTVIIVYCSFTLTWSRKRTRYNFLPSFFGLSVAFICVFLLAS